MAIQVRLWNSQDKPEESGKEYRPVYPESQGYYSNETIRN